MAELTSLDAMERLEIDSEDEYDDLPQTGQPANTMAERRRKQKAIFDSWLISDAGRQALKPKTREAKLNDAADEELSIGSLMAKQGTKIIKSPRAYQLELFERAKKENTIAVLDTGSGKTLIAVLLLHWILDQELEHRAAGNPPKLSFFLVASVTLVYQQHAVLENNLDHKVAKVSGADSNNWRKDKWLNMFTENKVIVCTADILHQCLSHSYITIKQINLLIFDEAHHAKKNHAYARIIKDFYLTETDNAFRPRVFGMTASPIDARSDVGEAARELETLLDSKIATTIDMSLTDAVKKPTEQILRYTPLLQPYETQLLQAVKARFGDVEIFKRVFDTCPEVARQLGSWCADLYLIDALSEKNLGQYENKVTRKFNARTGRNDVKELDQQQADVRSAIDFMVKERVKLLSTAITTNNLSSKVVELYKWLHYQFERPSSHRCIVFVEQRHIARLLNALFQRIGLQYMKCACLVGHNASEIEGGNSTFRSQVFTLHKFKIGEFNCLFSTSVAEEGLDVPDCNLVIRFDMYRTMIQYVQSRGRARKEHSKFLHMTENGNSTHEQLVSEVRYQEMVMRRFCQALPEDRRLLGDEDHGEELMSREKGRRVYIEPATGAKLTYGNALAYLANFVAVMTSQTEEAPHPTYVVTSQGSKFISEVLLPPGAGIRSATGRICMRKSLAKRSAAFEACIELRKRQELDDHLMPKIQRKRHIMNNAMLAVGMDKKNQYVMRTKPSIWEMTRGSLPSELWITVVDFPAGLEREHQPLAFLTRTRMPHFPEFPVFLNDSRESVVASRQANACLKVQEGTVERLTAFTLRVFKDVFSKTYEDDATKLSYWLAPVSITSHQAVDAAPEAILDWELLNQVFMNEKYQWTPDMPNESLLNRFLVDEGDGSRKFYTIAIDPKLRPHDPVPNDTAKFKWNENILDYSVSLWKKSRKERVWHPDQPVIETEKILTRRNMLATPDPKEISLRTKAFLCPEPLRISALTPAVVASCLVWPAVIHRFESYLIAMEACKMVGVVCSPDVALAAVTKDSDNSGEHESEVRINFQKGMGANYERLEFIGDTFLKTATTISTFIQNPNDNESDFHVKRMVMLCNSNLFEVAKKLGFYEYVRSMAFSRRLWYPNGIKLLEGKGVNKEEENAVIKHTLASKTIADVCEAMIGAAFVSHNKPGDIWHEEQWENAIRTVTKLVRHPDHAMAAWNDYRVAYEIPSYQTGDVTAAQRDLAGKIELEHAYHFKYPHLLRSAFNHPSLPILYEKIPNYQRLEFLGDALMDMASITHLFYRFPDKDPQWLTEHKMAMVSNKFLGAVCVDIGFQRHLRYTNSSLEYQIREYATELLEAKRTAGNSRDYWTTVSDPPKCLPDIVESYVGAMFVDSDFDFNVVQNFFETHIKWYFEDISLYDTFANNHPCTHLHNLLQTTYGCQDYRLMAREFSSNGVDEDRADIVAVVIIHNEIVAHTMGKSGKYARTRVASRAIEAVEGLAPFEFRSRFECDCQQMADSDNASGSGNLTAGNVPADCSI